MQVKKSFKIRITWDTLLASIIVLWLNNGVYSLVRRYIPSIVMYGIFAMWFLGVIYQPKYRSRIVKEGAYLSIPFIFLVYEYLNFKSGLVYSYVMFMVYVFMLISFSVTYHDNERKITCIYNIWKIDSLLIIFNTIIQLRSNPMIIRQMSINVASMGSLFGGQKYVVANFATILCYVVASLYLFSLILKKRKLSKSSWILFIGMIYLIMASQIGLLIGFEGIGILLIFLSNKITNSKKLLEFIVPIFIVLVLFVINIDHILTFFANAEWMPELLRVKVIDLSNILSGNTGNLLDAQVRIEQYEKGIQAFKNNIFFGTSGDSANIGGHATWLDMLGLFGLRALIFFIWLVRTMSNFMTKGVGFHEKIGIYIIIALVIVFGFLDPILTQISFIFMIVIMQYYRYKSST